MALAAADLDATAFNCVYCSYRSIVFGQEAWSQTAGCDTSHSYIDQPGVRFERTNAELIDRGLFGAPHGVAHGHCRRQ